ncbi:MAG: hypothetical protein E4G99_00020 [Anaerolineales bacterium]|nr:MAG: hypothetical protein E4G99_00020 [Anaerolineales bacterium]
MVPKPRPIDYLIVGHVTQDLTPQGAVLGGTASFSGLTAHALGRRVGILTAAASDIELGPLCDLQVHCLDSEATSTFQNTYGPEGRIQHILARAEDLRFETLPPEWSTVGLLHCAPVANEVDQAFLTKVSSHMVGLTPQGWLRQWDPSGEISLNHWEIIRPYLTPASVVVLSQEDLGGTIEATSEIAMHCRILAVTMGAEGALVFAEGESRHLPAPEVTEVDPTGCGDIFATIFFVCLENGDSPWTAAAISNQLAARSVTRAGLASIPLPEEIQAAFQLRVS